MTRTCSNTSANKQHIYLYMYIYIMYIHNIVCTYRYICVEHASSISFTCSHLFKRWIFSNTTSIGAIAEHGTGAMATRPSFGLAGGPYTSCTHRHRMQCRGHGSSQQVRASMHIYSTFDKCCTGNTHCVW